jgi:endonuclease YncB( thermonuclease family)
MKLDRCTYACALVGAAAFAAVSARAQESALTALGAAAACTGADAVSGEVMNVIDGKSFRLADGREVRLAAIESPPLTAAGPDDARGQAGLAARAALEEIVLHRQLAARPAASPDRYGRLIAYAFVAGPSGETFVQRELLANGQALFSPAGIASPCRSVLRAAEGAARAAGLGLWADPYYGVRRADHPADILLDQGRFALVEGRVVSVRERGGIVYVNFGRRWDFTVTILKRNERLFAGAGLVPSRLAGRRIEVRGFVEERGGPAIEVLRPEQIEIVPSID